MENDEFIKNQMKKIRNRFLLNYHKKRIEIGCRNQ